jgi:hypothetical protein
MNEADSKDHARAAASDVRRRKRSKATQDCNRA